MVDKVKARVMRTFFADEIVAMDEQVKKVLPRYTKDELANAKYRFGEIFICGLAANDGAKKIKDLGDVVNQVAQYKLMRYIPNTSWFMDIETGEYFKMAEQRVGNNKYYNIYYYTNQFKHGQMYVVEFANLCANLADNSSVYYGTEFTLGEIKEIFKSNMEERFARSYAYKMTELQK